MSTSDLFQREYGRLNTEQRHAVDTIEGPVMVVAGPGTGKTQVLALRIANILVQTDTPADGILCLTFTNSGVRAMRERLRTYIGSDALSVTITTFHSFGMRILEDHYAVLGFDQAPQLLDETASVVLCDELLHSRSWNYIRPRNKTAQYLKDITALISLMKRSRNSSDQMRQDIRATIDTLESDPDNVSSRGPTKGQLKKEVQDRIQQLQKTAEALDFYDLYESAKRERNIIDYDDVLEYVVQVVQQSDTVRDLLRERFLYVLVDEHQDSSGVQNEFLRTVWQGVEQPNIFVVGDDRQLIYGFGGASLDYFAEFRHTFGTATMITLRQNYRSVQSVLDFADTLLKSTLADTPLLANRSGDTPVLLASCQYPRDELLLAGVHIQQRIAQGLDPSECAVLVPKNSQVRTAVRVLRDMGIPVMSGGTIRLFDIPETQSLLRVLRIVADPGASDDIAQSLFDPTSKIPVISAHQFIRSQKPKQIQLSDLSNAGAVDGMFADSNPVSQWGGLLQGWIEYSNSTDLYGLVQHIGTQLLLDSVTDHETLLRRIEIVRTMLHLVISQSEIHPEYTLGDFLEFIQRLREYEHDIPLAVLSAHQGVRVLTLHSSKGLEFDWVWIAHMDERSVAGGRTRGFTLPDSVAQLVEQKDEQVIRRQIYVAITRAREQCIISYATHSYTGGETGLATVLQQIPDHLYIPLNTQHTEELLIQTNPKLYVSAITANVVTDTKQSIADMVRTEYQSVPVSVTLLNNFFECPWKWYVRSLLKLPEPIGVPAQFGSVVHGVLENILSKRSAVTDAEIKTYIQNHIAKQHLQPSMQQQVFDESFVVVRNWIRQYQPSLANRYETERSLSIHSEPVPDLVVTGKIDLIEYISDSTISITDFKTGSPKSASAIEKLNDDGRMSDYMRQLAMYSFLISGSYRGAISVTTSKLLFLEAEPGDKNAVYQTHITSDHLDRLFADLREYDTALSSGLWIHRPCTARNFGSDTECPYCALVDRITQ